jgi:hypothetical protein
VKIRIRLLVPISHRILQPGTPMTEENWQRLRNLSLFKLWVTDKQLRRWWPLAAFIALVILLVTAVGRLFTS